jgi:hypothetical protein
LGLGIVEARFRQRGVDDIAEACSKRGLDAKQPVLVEVFRVGEVAVKFLDQVCDRAQARALHAVAAG